MKGKILSLAILSLVGSVFFILMLVGFSGHHLEYRDSHFKNEWDNSSLETLYNIGAAFFGILVIAQFVIGIIVLATNSKAPKENNGLRTASGVIGILGGVIFVNIIVAGLAYCKEPLSESKPVTNDLPVTTPKDLKTQEIELLKKEVEILKRENDLLKTTKPKETEIVSPKQSVKKKKDI